MWLQVAAADVKELGLAAAMEDAAPLERGGVLYHDSMHGVWLYEGEALQARLMALKQVLHYQVSTARYPQGQKFSDFWG